MTVPYDTILFAALIITSAFAVFGLTGFGSSIVAVPFLAQFFPLHFVVPLMALLEPCVALLFGTRNHRAVSRPEILRMLPFLLCGMAVGSIVLVTVSEQILLFGLGGFVLAYVCWTLLSKPGEQLASAAWAAPSGLVGGMFSAVFGTGGPVYVMYLARRLRDKDALRATIAIAILLSGLVRLAIFSVSDLYHSEVLWLAAMLIPCALFGLYAGTLLYRRLPARRVVHAVYVVLVVGGLNLIVRAAGM